MSQKRNTLTLFLPPEVKRALNTTENNYALNFFFKETQHATPGKALEFINPLTLPLCHSYANVIPFL